MITRTHLRIDTAIIYSWKNLLYSFLCALLAYLVHTIWDNETLIVPTSVVAILGTALAIILGFRNTSAYERWWEARKIWGSIVNESRTLTRQVLTIVDPHNLPPGLWEASTQVVRRQLGWINALRLQLRGNQDEKEWLQHVARHLSEEDYKLILSKTNKVTQLAMLQGNQIKEMNAQEILDIFSYIQMDDTLTRLTDLQGMCERIKSTPLPRPYDYYTMAFLSLFIFFFPFAFMSEFEALNVPYLIFPVSMLVGWIFYQIYIFGKVLSRPFDNMKTDVALNAICTTIEIDLKEIIEDKDVPAPLMPVDGALM